MCVIDALIIMVTSLYMALVFSLKEIFYYFVVFFLIGWLAGYSLTKVEDLLSVTVVFYLFFHSYSDRTAL